MERHAWRLLHLQFTTTLGVQKLVQEELVELQTTKRGIFRFFGLREMQFRNSLLETKKIDLTQNTIRHPFLYLLKTCKRGFSNLAAHLLRKRSRKTVNRKYAAGMLSNRHFTNDFVNRIHQRQAVLIVDLTGQRHDLPRFNNLREKSLMEPNRLDRSRAIFNQRLGNHHAPRFLAATVVDCCNS